MATNESIDEILLFVHNDYKTIMKIMGRRENLDIFVSIAVAAVLWFIMFNPWIFTHGNFWLLMTNSAALLMLLAVLWGKTRMKPSWKHIGLGIIIAAALWGIFWVGDKLSAIMFNFSRPQVDSIYAMGDGVPKWLVAVLLLIVIGPAEEIFWRGFIQKRIGDSCGRLPAMFITLAIYTLIHIWSLNFMLVMASMVAGAVWGFLYYLKPGWLPALVISHALWDAAVFVIFPI